MFRYVELVATGLLALALFALDFPAGPFGRYLGTDHHRFTVGIVTLLQIALVTTALRRFRRRASPGAFTAVVALLCAGGVFAVHRQGRIAKGGTPQHQGRSSTPRDEHYFALRLMAAVLADDELLRPGHPVRITDLAVPEHWPLPAGTRFRIHRDSLGTTTIYSSLEGENLSCRIQLRDRLPTGDDLDFRCEALTLPDAGEPPPRIRETEMVGGLPRKGAGNWQDAWPQYRYDAGKSGGRATGETDAPLWYASMAGAARATASIAGPLVLIGTHGSGALEAHQRTTGALVWRTREPNWVHQDPISDGRRVYVGFGDNGGSLVGVAPSGVTAHDLLTGRRLWTRFVHGSVMTSPVVWDSLVIFGSARSEALALEAASGAVRWQKTLPGTVIMGPPLLVGDTVVFTLDDDTVCALLARSGESLWCTELSGLPRHAPANQSGRRIGYVGHVGASSSWGLVFGTATTTLSPLELFWRQGWRAVPDLRAWVTSGELPSYAAQETFALRLHDGAVLWRTKIGEGWWDRPGRTGHMSGTPVPVASDSTLVVVSPMGDQMIRLSAFTGERYTRASPLPQYPRGPALVIADTILAQDPAGVLHVLDRTSMHERCSTAFPEPVDRAGPTLAGAAVIVAGTRGGLYSVPLSALLACGPGLAARLAAMRDSDAAAAPTAR